MSSYVDPREAGCPVGVAARASAAFREILLCAAGSGEAALAVVSKAAIGVVLKKDPAAAGVLLKELEENADGAVSEAEWLTWFALLASRSTTEATTQLDCIEDSLPHDEFTTPLSAISPLTPPDSGGKGKNNQDLIVRAKEAFASILKAGGGSEVSKAELGAVLGGKDRLAANVFFKELDENLDGGVSEAEWLRWFDLLLQKGNDEAESQIEWIEEALQQTPSTDHVSAVDTSSLVLQANEPRKALVERAKLSFKQVLWKTGKPSTGEVSKEELTKVLRKDKLAAKVLFKELDENSDGGISEKEWLHWFDILLVKGHDEAESQIEWIEEALDNSSLTGTPVTSPSVPSLVVQANGPRMVLVERAKKAFNAVLKKSDKPATGEVSKTELTTVLRKDKLAAKVLFKELDENSDGGISEKEWLHWFDVLLVKGHDEAESQIEWIEEALSAPHEKSTIETESSAVRLEHANEPREKLVARAKAEFQLILKKTGKPSTGEVSKEELTKVLRKDKLAAKVLFKQLDENSDGGISEKEWLHWFDILLVKGHDEAESQIEWIEAALDNNSLAGTPITSPSVPSLVVQANGPRMVLVERAKKAFNAVLKKSGKPATGEVSKTELTKVLRKDKLAAMVLFKELDENSDGGISDKEWLHWFDVLLVKGHDEAESQIEWIEEALASSGASTPEELSGTLPLAMQRAMSANAVNDGVRARAAAAFAKILHETNTGKGEVSKAELSHVLKRDKLGAKVLFKELDENSDGGISETEWLHWFDILLVKGHDEAESQIEWIEEALSAPHEKSTIETESSAVRLEHANEPREKLVARAKAEFQLILKKTGKPSTGEVSKEELTKVLRKDKLAAKVLFKQLDENSDGGISEKEWLHWFDILLVKGHDEAESQIEWIEAALDNNSLAGTPITSPSVPSLVVQANGPRMVLVERAKKAFNAVLKKSGKPATGEVSKTELTKVLRKDKLAAMVLFKELDENSDGGISDKEWLHWFDVLLVKGHDEAESQIEWIEEALASSGASTPEELSGTLPLAMQRAMSANAVNDGVRARAAAAFAKILHETNTGKGEVSKAELSHVLKRDKLGAKVLFKELDENSDGGISETEWLHWFDILLVKGHDEAESQIEWIEEALSAPHEKSTIETESSAVRLEHANEPREKLVARAKAEFQLILKKTGKPSTGEVSKEELTKVLRKDKLAAKVLFKQLDENSDGGISEKEWLHWFDILLVKGHDEAESQIEWIEAALDNNSLAGTPITSPSVPSLVVQANGPRMVLVERAKKAFNAVLKKSGKPATGEVSKTELTKVLRKDKLAAMVLFKELDENSDGGISDKEWLHWFDVLLVKGHDEAESQIEWIEEALASSGASTPEELSGTLPLAMQRAMSANAVNDGVRARAAAAFAKILHETNTGKGEVSKAELSHVLKRDKLGAKVLFKELDENSDGGISETEWLHWFDILLVKGHDEAESQIEWIEEALSAPHEKSTIETESSAVRLEHANEPREKLVARAKAEFQLILKKSGKPATGEVSKTELTKVLRKDKLAAKVLFKELDENSDGGISETEWLHWFDILLVKGHDEAESQIEWIEEALQDQAVSPLVSPATAPLMLQDANLPRKSFVARAKHVFQHILLKSGKPATGEVSKAELTKILRKDKLAAKVLFKELDENSDGGVSEKEWLHWFDILLVKGHDEAESQIEWIEDGLQIETTTEDKSAPLVYEQRERLEFVLREARRTFELIDSADHNGELSRDEILDAFGPERLAAKILFKELDENVDGGISITEWIKFFQTRYDRKGVDEAESAITWILDVLNTKDLDGPTDDRTRRTDIEQAAHSLFEDVTLSGIFAQDTVQVDSLQKAFHCEGGDAVELGRIFTGLPSDMSGRCNAAHFVSHIRQICNTEGAAEAEATLRFLQARQRRYAGEIRSVADVSRIEGERRSALMALEASGRAQLSTAVGSVWGTQTTYGPSGGCDRSHFACVFFAANSLTLPRTRRDAIAKHVTTPLTTVPDATPGEWAVSPNLATETPRLFDPTSIDPLRSYPVGMRLGGSLLAKLGRVPSRMETVAGIPSVALQPPLWQQADYVEEVVVAGRAKEEGEEVGVSSADVFGGRSFVITPCELADMESTLRVTMNEEEIPRPFYALLTANFTANTPLAAHFSVRKSVPLGEMFSRSSDDALVQRAQTRHQNAKRRLELLKEQASTPYSEEVWQQEQFVAHNKEVVQIVQRAATSAGRTLVHDFKAFLAEVRDDHVHFGFTSPQHVHEVLSKTMIELASTVCISQRGYLMVHGKHRQYRGQICPKTRRSITFIFATAGIDFCGADSTAVEAPKYFARSPQPEGTPSHIGFENFVLGGEFEMRRRVRGIFEAIFESARIHGVKYLSVPSIGLGEYLANVNAADARRIAEIYYEEQCDLLCESNFGLQCCYLHTGDAARFAIAHRVLAARRDSTTGQHYLRCSIVFHYKDVKCLAQTLAEEGHSAGVVICSDTEVLLQGCFGTFWEKGVCMEYAECEDAVCNATIATMCALGAQLGSRALATSTPIPSLSTPTKTVRIPLTENGVSNTLGVYFINETVDAAMRVRIYEIVEGSAADNAGAVQGVLTEAGGVVIRCEADFTRTVHALRTCNADHIELRIIPDDTGLGLLSKAVRPLDDLNTTLQDRLIFLPASPSYVNAINNTTPRADRAPTHTPSPRRASISPPRLCSPHNPSRVGFGSSVPRDMAHHCVRDTPSMSPGPGAYIKSGSERSGVVSPQRGGRVGAGGGGGGGLHGVYGYSVHGGSGSTGGTPGIGDAAPRIHPVERPGPGPSDYRPEGPAAASPQREKGVLSRDGIARIAKVEISGPGPGEYNTKRWLE